MPAGGATTLLAVRTSVRQQTDQVNSLFVTDVELNGYIQSAYQELFGIIVQAFGADYFTQGTAPYSFTTDGINSLFALPDGSGAFPAFFKLLGVDLALQGNSQQYIALKPFAFADRNLYSGLFNQSVPPAGQTIRVFYVPQLTLPTMDADVIQGVNGWEDYIVCKAGMMVMAKEESDSSVFAQRLSQMERRLTSEVENRDAANPSRIVDGMGRGAQGMMYRLNGNSLWLIGSGTPGWYGDWGGSSPGWY